VKIRLLLILFSLSTIFLFVEWKTADTSGRDISSTASLLKKKKKKKKKKKTKKKNGTKATKKPVSARDSAAYKKREAKREKNLNKVLDKKAKKQKKLDKASEEAHKPFDDCDSTRLVRTSQDTQLLVKYIKIYRSLGGVCYILHLQDMAKLHQDSVGIYSVQIRPSTDPRAPAAWQTYLYCPIGKPNGKITLISPEGDTLQTCYYQDEKKSGLMTYYKKGKGIIYVEKYVNDEKVWVKKEDE
jgi:hypothetical protein